MIILLLCSCSRKMHNYYPPKIYSIDTIISELYPEAITWQTDAFLSEVHFDLKEDTILNTATFFYSPTNEYESLNIYLYDDGTIKKNIITHKLQIKLTKQLDEILQNRF